jgi:hypoxanthine-DNA glycosylase
MDGILRSPSPPRIHGLPPIENPSARILILGSMPGEASLRAGQYYAHPQNQFWKIIGEVLAYAPPPGANPAGLREAPYDERLHVLTTAGIALWDVLASCHRKGSLDSDIVPDTLVANDFAAFFAAHRRIERVLFNGAKAEACFRRHVVPSRDRHEIEFLKLPSTSPANASIPYAPKLAAWRAAIGDR